MELSQEIKNQIIAAKLNEWQKQHYSLLLDVKVAQAINDDKMLEAVKTQLKTVIAALETLQIELDK